MFYLIQINLNFKESTIKFVKFKEIRNSDKIPFYNRTRSLYHDNKYFVYDYGNSEVYAFDSNLNTITFINIKGSGPGQFNQSISSFFICKDYLLLANYAKIAIYDFNFNLINEISLIRKKKMGLSYPYKGNILIFHGVKGKDLFSIINFEGELYKVLKNNKYDPNDIGFSHDGRNFLTYRNKTYFVEKGSYKIRTFDINLNESVFLKRDFMRRKNINYKKELIAFEKIFGPINNLNNKNVNFSADIPSEYYSDINREIGLFENYLILLVNSDDKNHLNLDLINLDNMTYDRKKLYFEKDDFIMNISISANKLLIDYSNINEGPSVLIYNILK